MSKEEFFKDWDSDNVKEMGAETQNHIYMKYLLKCEVFQRDEFKCQNKGCLCNGSSLTLHHIKFRKNNGKDKARNAVTLCKTCHSAYHRGKIDLTFNGSTYRIHQEGSSVDWKALKSKNRKFRKTLIQVKGYKISWEMLRLLMKFLDKEYTELLEEEIDDD